MSRLSRLAGVGAIALLSSAPVAAEWIDFDELPAANDAGQILSDEYAHLGAHFGGIDDGATWSGVSGGDPGQWAIDGTSGPAFLGFDGSGYAMAIDFDAPVRSFQLDVARATGAIPFLFDQFRLSGFREGRLVETTAVFFGGVDEWKTLSLAGEVDRVVWFGTGLAGHRYGVDDLRWEGLEPQVIPVAIEIRPGAEGNPVALHASGVVPVLVYGDEDFAVEDVDPATLGFGPAAAPPAHRHGPHFGDSDRDGLLDMLVHHRLRDAEIPADAGEACVTGATYDGRLFEGCDAVTPVPR